MRLEIAGCLSQLGQLEGALEHARLATAYWREHEPQFTMFQQSAHFMVADLLAELDRIDEARAEYEHLLAIVDLDSSEAMRNMAKRSLEELSRREVEPGAR